MANVSPQAPGRLELVRRFVNSRNIELGSDAFHAATGLTEWLHEAGLLADASVAHEVDLEYAVEVREALRDLLQANLGAAPVPAPTVQLLNDALRRSDLRISFTAGATWTAAAVAPACAVDAAMGELLSVVIEAMSSVTWSRLKVCINDECGWAFYDHSRARSGKWCSMGVCGNRVKQRSWRARQASTS
jgi:predicted RNA-binding Zn ribbon-like protein